MIIGYARCSTADQSLDWQLDKLKEYGCERIFQEKMTGSKIERPELSRMLDTLREGDIVMVCELTRLSRSTRDLFTLVERINKLKADIKSLKESWLDTTTPQGRFMFTISAGVSQFERELLVQRTRDGLKAARARGRNGGRPGKDKKSVKDALTLYDSRDYSIKEIIERTGVCKTTLYKYIGIRKKKQKSSNA